MTIVCLLMPAHYVEATTIDQIAAAAAAHVTHPQLVAGLADQPELRAKPLRKMPSLIPFYETEMTGRRLGVFYPGVGAPRSPPPSTSQTLECHLPRCECHVHHRPTGCPTLAGHGRRGSQGR
jgi:hypothetical protein